MPINHSACRAFIHSVCATVINGGECLSGAELLVPSRDQSIFADKNELGRQRVTAVAHFEERGLVRHNPGWIGPFGIIRACWNRYYQWISRIGKGMTVRKINRRNAGTIVSDPD